MPGEAARFGLFDYSSWEQLFTDNHYSSDAFGIIYVIEEMIEEDWTNEEVFTYCDLYYLV